MTVDACWPAGAPRGATGPLGWSPDASRIWVWAWLAWVVFVVYGSLVPLEFRALPWDQALQRFAQVPMLRLGVEQRADWVANGVLYVPIGFLSAALMMGPRAGGIRRLSACLAAVGFGVLLAFAVEFAQLFFPPRTVSRNDLIAESIGTVLGAALAWRGRDWLQALLPALRGHWRVVAARLLPAYALALVALSLFPFDLLISGTELAAKLHGGLWGFLLAQVHAESSMLTLLARLAAEALVVVPLGWLWARRTHGATLAQAALLGAGLGVGIELAQFFVASGVSQGASVLTRALGWTLGAWLWQGNAQRNFAWWREQLRRGLWPLALLHLVALLLLSGWFGSRWLGWDGALARLAGNEVRFIPFYYHYYTSEAVALGSLLSVALLYMPLALWAWVRGWTVTVGAWLGAGLAVVVEAGKLFYVQARPDPTNVLVAAAAVGLALVCLYLLQAPAAARAQPWPGWPGEGLPARPTGASGLPGPVQGLRLAPLGLALTVALAAAWFANFPLPGLAFGALVIAAAGLVWWRPVCVFALIPLMLPLLDLAPWTGALYVDEFDLLAAVLVAVALLRTPPTVSPRRVADRALAGALLAVAASIALGVLVGLEPLQGLSLDDLGSPIGPWQSLRLAKGLVWAALLWVLARRMQAAGEPFAVAFGWGMTLGLLGVALVVMWERAAFVSLWDLVTPYRVAGPFSAMQVGGAYLEAYIAAGLAFALHGMLHGPGFAARALALAAALGGSYALAVTFSRAGYAAGAAVLVLMCVLTLRGAVRSERGQGSLLAVGGRAVLAVAALMAVVALAWPVVTGSFARERMSTIATDLQVRESHWSRAYSTAGWLQASTWLGHGLGQFPAVNYWQRLPLAETAPLVEGDALAVHRFTGHGRDAMLQIGPGSSLYVDQIIQVQPGQVSPGQVLALQVDARALDPDAQLTVSLCHKWLISSADCVVTTVQVGSATGDWQNLNAAVNTGLIGGDTGLVQRPVRLSLSSRAKVRIDVRQVALKTAEGRDLLVNGRFMNGGDRWTFTSDDHLGWHLHNLPLSLWFELGVPGVLAMGWLLGLAGWRSARAAWSGGGMAPACCAALTGFLVVSAFDTLIDTPRFLLLLLALAGLAAMSPRRGSHLGT